MTTIARHLPNNKELGTIFNNDINNILCAGSPDWTAEEYKRCVRYILEAKPGVLAQNVGMPDPVIYQSRVATLWCKYYREAIHALSARHEDVQQEQRVEAHVFENILAEGTDVFQVTIEACREAGVPIVASYRMNAEDYHEEQLNLSDFARERRHLAIPGANCLDPAHKEVYAHRLDIFHEVADRYDIDGIEFDFRRWTHMISNPLENHPVLTRMVRDTRRLLDEAARAKGRKRLLLGVRVGPKVSGGTDRDEFPGGQGEPADASCEHLGLDVTTWIKDELVDYVCPSLFWPRWPGLPKTAEFVDLAQAKNVGVYPTLFPLPGWLEKERDEKGPIALADRERLMRYKNEFCDLAVQLYDDGADGVSTYNWYFHLRKARVANLWCDYYGYGPGGDAVQEHILSILDDPEAIRRYRHETRAIPRGH